MKMKYTKKVLTVILSLSMACSLAPVKAEAASAMKLNEGLIRKLEIPPITYRKNEDGETFSVSHYNGTDFNVTIPAEHEGCKVTEIGNAAFANNNTLESVTVPEGVTKIGDDFDIIQLKLVQTA